MAMTRPLRSTGITPLQRYYEAVRPSPAHRYFRPRGWSRLHLFPWHRRPGSHVPYKSPIELRAAYMPDAAWAVSGIRHIGGAKLNRAFVWNVRTWPAMPREKVQAAPTARPKVPMRRRGADCLVIALKRGNARGAKGAGHRHWLGSTGNGRNPMINGRRHPSCGGTSRMNREVHVRNL